MQMPHDPGAVERLREPTAADPWRVLLSGCMAGLPCGVDGTDYGFGGVLDAFFDHPHVRPLGFCPEDAGLGTPRGWPDIHGGDGEDVLAGRARVFDQHGNDLTAGMIAGAEAAARFAARQRIDFAVLLDMSAACGSQVISDGSRFVEPRAYRRGLGVAAARLVRAGIPVVSQRDRRTLEALRARLDPDHVPDPDARDHHEGEWYQATFLGQPPPA